MCTQGHRGGTAFTTLVIVAVLSAAEVSAASAATTPDDAGSGSQPSETEMQPSLQLEEITVTARKRAEKAIDVPFSLQVLDGKDLTQLGALDFSDYARTVAGVSFVTAASCTLVLGLFVQTLVLTIYLLARAPDVLGKILGLWKPSLLAGFTGAFASQFWFLAFALTAAANVRTLALVEVLFAQGVAYYSFKQPLSGRELSGIALIVVGVALLVAV